MSDHLGLFTPDLVRTKSKNFLVEGKLNQNKHETNLINVHFTTGTRYNRENWTWNKGWNLYQIVFLNLCLKTFSSFNHCKSQLWKFCWLLEVFMFTIFYKQVIGINVQISCITIFFVVSKMLFSILKIFSSNLYHVIEEQTIKNVLGPSLYNLHFINLHFSILLITTEQ